MSDIELINQEYYNKLYKQGNVFLRWLHCNFSFDQQSKLNPNRSAIAPFLESILKEQGIVRVLDYGCGWGLFLLDLPEKQVEAFGYDISENAMAGLEAVMRRFGRKLNRIAFKEDRRITPGDFDIIVCSHVMEHVADDVALISRLAAALRPGGYLLINVPINEPWSEPKHARAYTPEDLKGLLLEAGLKIAEERQVDKLGGVLRQPEPLNRGAKPRSVLIRAMCAGFALLPYGAVLWAEKAFLSKQEYQQLIVIGRK